MRYVGIHNMHRDCKQQSLGDSTTCKWVTHVERVESVRGGGGTKGVTPVERGTKSVTLVEGGTNSMTLVEGVESMTLVEGVASVKGRGGTKGVTLVEGVESVLRRYNLVMHILAGDRTLTLLEIEVHC